MKSKRFLIHIYNPKEEILSELKVEKIGENEYRAVENDLFDCRLTLGTEFKTKVNKDGNREVLNITKKSPYITYQFLLSKQGIDVVSDLFLDELVKKGGYWQIDFGGYLTINIPPSLVAEVDEVIKSFNTN